MTPIAIIRNVDRILEARAMSLPCRKMVREAILAATDPIPAGVPKTIQEVCEAMCHVSGVTPGDLKGPSRKGHLPIIRNLCMYIVYREVGNAYQDQIARYFRRERSTATHAIASIEHLIDIRDEKVLTYYNLYKEQQG